MGMFLVSIKINFLLKMYKVEFAFIHFITFFIDNKLSI